MRAYRRLALVSAIILAACGFPVHADDMSGEAPWTKDELIKRLDVEQQPGSDVKTRGIKPVDEAEEPPADPGIGVVEDLRVLFEFDSAELTAAARQQLDVFAEALESPALSDDRFVIAGHTDAVGDENYNRSLSRQRAQAVVDYLSQVHGISRQRLISQGYGESRLRDPSDPSSQVNRRVEVVNDRVAAAAGSDMGRQ